MPYWLYVLLSVPVLSAFIGWLTNWQAVKMIFWPARRMFGWQGIVYAHADKFATNLGQIYRSADGGERWTKLRRELGEIRAILWRPA